MRLQSGDTLRALIKQRGMNQTRLATAAGCSPSFINSLCVGAKSSCTDTLAGRIAEVLEVPTSVLFAPIKHSAALSNINQQASHTAAVPA